MGDQVRGGVWQGAKHPCPNLAATRSFPGAVQLGGGWQLGPRPASQCWRPLGPLFESTTLSARSGRSRSMCARRGQRPAAAGFGRESDAGRTRRRWASPPPTETPRCSHPRPGSRPVAKQVTGQYGDGVSGARVVRPRCEGRKAGCHVCWTGGAVPGGLPMWFLPGRKGDHCGARRPAHSSTWYLPGGRARAEGPEAAAKRFAHAEGALVGPLRDGRAAHRRSLRGPEAAAQRFARGRVCGNPSRRRCGQPPLAEGPGGRCSAIRTSRGAHCGRASAGTGRVGEKRAQSRSDRRCDR